MRGKRIKGCLVHGTYAKVSGTLIPKESEVPLEEFFGTKSLHEI